MDTQRQLVEDFKRDLPAILEGKDPMEFVTVEAIPGADFETRKCNVEGCEWYVYQADQCSKHHHERWRK